MEEVNYLLLGILVIIALCGIKGLSEGFVRTAFRLLLNIVVMLISIFVTPVLVRNIFHSFLTEGTDALQQVPIMFVLYLLLRVGAKALVSSLDLIAKLPVLRTMNRLLGFVAGVAQGLLIVWTVFLFAELFQTTNWGMWIHSMSETNEYVKYLYEHNVLKSIIMTYVLKQ